MNKLRENLMLYITMYSGYIVYSTLGVGLTILSLSGGFHMYSSLIGKKIYPWLFSGIFEAFRVLLLINLPIKKTSRKDKAKWWALYLLVAMWLYGTNIISYGSMVIEEEGKKYNPVIAKIKGEFAKQKNIEIKGFEKQLEMEINKPVPRASNGIESAIAYWKNILDTNSANHPKYGDWKKRLDTWIKEKQSIRANFDKKIETIKKEIKDFIEMKIDSPETWIKNNGALLSIKIDSESSTGFNQIFGLIGVDSKGIKIGIWFFVSLIVELLIYISFSTARKKLTTAKSKLSKIDRDKKRDVNVDNEKIEVVKIDSPNCQGDVNIDKDQGNCISNGDVPLGEIDKQDVNFNNGNRNGKRRRKNYTKLEYLTELLNGFDKNNKDGSKENLIPMKITGFSNNSNLNALGREHKERFYKDKESYREYLVDSIEKEKEN